MEPIPKVIHKHKIDIALQVAHVRLPARHEIVAFNIQNREFVFWEMHDAPTDDQAFMFSFVVLATGTRSPEGYYVLGHRGTCFHDEYVFHLVEVAKQS